MLKKGGAAMTAKDYLSQARVLDQAIDARLERVARLRALVPVVFEDM